MRSLVLAGVAALLALLVAMAAAGGADAMKAPKGCRNYYTACVGGGGGTSQVL